MALTQRRLASTSTECHDPQVGSSIDSVSMQLQTVATVSETLHSLSLQIYIFLLWATSVIVRGEGGGVKQWVRVKVKRKEKREESRREKMSSVEQRKEESTHTHTHISGL